MAYCEIFLIFAEKYKTINHMLDKERGLYIAHCANGALSITGKMAVPQVPVRPLRCRSWQRHSVRQESPVSWQT